MRSVTAVENLRSFALLGFTGGLLGALLRWEAWLDARRSRRALYALDERALADIGLTSADLGWDGSAPSWHGALSGATAPPAQGHGG